MKKALYDTLLTAIVVVAIAGMIMLSSFIIANWFLGCESWDQEQWTANHSCITFSNLWSRVD